MLKALFLTHRYLGIFLGLVMVLWCLSGFIMMYKSYPELSDQERRELLPILQLADCCQVPASESLGVDFPYFHRQIQAILGLKSLIISCQYVIAGRRTNCG
ncbi:MAG: hypothetical protein P8M72_13405 [Gammaproteobacteria bacterium]|nr:hypothetical protein [Gammaproteobacteria bacterium]